MTAGKLISAAFFLLSGTMVFGQLAVDDQRILFRGVVISASTSERLAGSQIIINGMRYTLSHNDGTFSFYARRFDTIQFSMLGYKPEMIIVSDTLRSKEFLTGVYLQSDTLEIGEVIILPRFRNLKAEIMNQRPDQDSRYENAVSNVSVAAYVGRTSASKLGDPHSNYELLRNKQKTEAYEKGGIPSDRMVSLSPFLIVPAAYLLIHGLPEEPAGPPPGISRRDLDELNRFYIEFLRGKGKDSAIVNKREN